MQQILTDRTMLRSMRSEAEAARNYVETYFCNALLAVISELLPEDHEPCGLELRSTVMLKVAEVVEEPDETEEFLYRLAELVDALKVGQLLCFIISPATATCISGHSLHDVGRVSNTVTAHRCGVAEFLIVGLLQASLVRTSTIRPRSKDDESDSIAAPKRSPKEIACLEKDRHLQKLSCLEELLAVTADMPEVVLPLPQADVVLELASFGTVEPLLGCMDIRESPEARLQSAGMPPEHKS